MSEWWTYRLSSFLLFSERTYDRLFELYNADLWPAHVATLALGVALLTLPRDAGAARSRASLALLAGAWALVAWQFHYRRYATINWAAEYYAIVFALEAIVLAITAMRVRVAAQAPASDARLWAGRALLLVAVVAYPLLPLIAGRDWRAAEVFGLAPEPTAIGTLGALLLMRARLAVAALPLAWCVWSGLFLWPMRAAQAAIPLAAAVTAIAAYARSARRDATRRAGD
jgi:hypothetical protein